MKHRALSRRPVFRENGRAWMIFPAVLLAFFFNACAWIAPPPEEEPEWRRDLVGLVSANPELDQFKGIVQIRIQDEEKTSSARAALAADLPDRLRVEWLNMMGQPLSSLAADGQVLTIKNPGDERIHSVRQTERALEKLIKIPVGIHDMLLILAGRTPLPDFFAVKRLDAAEPGIAYALKNRWGADLALIFADDQGRLQSQEVFAVDGSLKYRIIWREWQNVDDFLLPRSIEIESAGGQRLLLTMNRYWTDVQIQPTMFTLRSPGEVR